MELLPGMEQAIRAALANEITALIKEMARRGIDKRDNGTRNKYSMLFHLETTSLMEADIDKQEKYIQHLRRRRDGKVDNQRRD